MKNNMGITLVALVITVIILLILAGVALSLIIGEKGLFDKSRQAGETYNEASRNELNKINSLLAVLDKETSNGQGGVENEFGWPESPNRTDIYIVNNWDDNDDEYGERPEKLVVAVYKGSNVLDEVGRVELSEANNWKNQILKLKEYDENNNKIEYNLNIIIDDNSFYQAEYNSIAEQIDGSQVNINFTVKLKYRPEYVDIKTTIIWDDNNNAYGDRPSSVGVTMYAFDGSGNQIDEFAVEETLTSEKNWEHTFLDLLKTRKDVTYFIVPNSFSEKYYMGIFPSEKDENGENYICNIILKHIE